jgi:hypothetical protein
MVDNFEDASFFGEILSAGKSFLFIFDPSTRASALAGGSRSGFRSTGAVEGATNLPLGLHGVERLPRQFGIGRRLVLPVNR